MTIPLMACRIDNRISLPLGISNGLLTFWTGHYKHSNLRECTLASSRHGWLVALHGLVTDELTTLRVITRKSSAFSQVE